MFSRDAIIRTWRVRVLLFVLVVGFFSFPIYGYVHPKLALKQRGMSTTGQVVALEPNNHQSVRYKYRVGETDYTGVWGPWPLQRMHVGDPIQVTYLPDRPDVSVSGTPDTRGWWVLPFVILPAMGLIAALFGLRASVGSISKGEGYRARVRT